MAYAAAAVDDDGERGEAVGQEGLDGSEGFVDRAAEVAAVAAEGPGAAATEAILVGPWAASSSYATSVAAVAASSEPGEGLAAAGEGGPATAVADHR